jgi:phosphate uptake regulator
MDIRKVQITGGSSFVITLPKEWAKANNLKKNAPLGLITQPDGTLLLTPRITGDQTLRTKVFDIKEVPDKDFLIRLLVGAYIEGYNVIKIQLKGPPSSMVRSVVREFTHLTIGQEVVEETANTITIKDLLNPAEMPLDKTIRRMYIIAKSMHEDAITSLLKGDLVLAEEVKRRDTEVDRLHWLVGRQYNLILHNVNLTEKLGVTIDGATTYYHISRTMERMADHAERIALNVPTLADKKVNPEILNKIKAASELSLEIFTKSMESLFKNDLKGSNEGIKDLGKLEGLCEEINTLALKHKGGIAIAVGYIVESIRRVGEYSVNISEMVINHIIAEEE